MHEINAVAATGALVTHLGIDDADDALIDDVERGAPNGDLVQTLLFLYVSQSCYRFEKVSTDINTLGPMVGVIIMDFETGVRKPKGSNKLSIRCCEHGVGGHPSDSVIWTKIACGIELMNGSLVKVMLKCKWGSKIGRLNELNSPGIFLRMSTNML